MCLLYPCFTVLVCQHYVKSDNHFQTSVKEESLWRSFVDYICLFALILLDRIFYFLWEINISLGVFFLASANCSKENNKLWPLFVSTWHMKSCMIYKYIINVNKNKYLLFDIQRERGCWAFNFMIKVTRIFSI